MIRKRIIPCLDIKDGKTVKGVNFVSLRQVGDPVAMARKYQEMGADELVILDISATVEGRKTFVDLVSRIAAVIDIPFTVGGGIASVEDAEVLFRAGADKVSVNSAAVENPSLIQALASRFGSRRVVAAIDAREVDGRKLVTTHGGGRISDKELLSWAKEVQDLGAGEVLYTSMDHDGTCKGYDCEGCRALSEILDIPLIASGGAGSLQDILDVLSSKGNADAALAASVFHYGEVTIGQIREKLQDMVLTDFEPEELDFSKNGDGLIPAVVQDASTLKVLMLGYMDRAALKKTLDSGLVTFFSRTRQCLWTKGETSGNYLRAESVFADCDKDTLLVKAYPCGPVCHTGAVSCFKTDDSEGFIRKLEQVIEERRQSRPEGSYTVRLFDKGVNKIAQKVGEEAVETVIEAVAHNDSAMIYEASDLIYHLLVLLKARNLSISDLEKELQKRHK